MTSVWLGQLWPPAGPRTPRLTSGGSGVRTPVRLRRPTGQAYVTHTATLTTILTTSAVRCITYEMTYNSLGETYVAIGGPSPIAPS